LPQNDHDPSRLIAETPFKLLRFLVEDGQHVNADEAYVEVEVMKMCMPLLTPAAGVIHFRTSEGSSVQAGYLIAALDLDDSSAVKRAVPFEGSLPELGTPTAVTARAHQHFAAALEGARMILAGYDHDIDTVVETLLSCLDDPHLPLLQWQETMSVLSARLPKELRMQLDTIWQDFRLSEALATEDASFEFPASYFRETLEVRHLALLIMFWR
jgi:acetyl-CoA carboxylase/biotin carboxylase 1